MNKKQPGLCAGFLLPHPPVLVPEVGKGREKEAAATLSAYQTVAAEMSKLQPDTVVLLSPHAPMFSDFIFMYNASVLTGDLRQFQAACQLSFPQDTALATEIERLMQTAQLPGGHLDEATMRRNRLKNSLDHGAIVPLYYLSSVYNKFALVVMAPSALDSQRQYQLGQLIRQAAEKLERRIVIVASGDLSHRVNQESPYGVCPEGAAFDRQLVEKISQGDLSALFTISYQLREKAAECGYGSLIALCGALDGLPIHTQVLSYEAPFGIGYCLARFLPEQPAANHSTETPTILERLRTELAEKNQTNSLYVQLARQALEEYVQNGCGKPLQKETWLWGNPSSTHPESETPTGTGTQTETRIQTETQTGTQIQIQIQTQTQIHTGIQTETETEELDSMRKNDMQKIRSEKAGVFVSLKKFGELRGCIGTTAPTTTCLAEEIRQNAISAGTRDSRFTPVTADELPFLEYSVDVLGKPEPVQSKAELNPQKYGVIVRKGARRGLLLPDLEGVNTVEEQLDIACRKAGIDPQDTYEIARFTVTRYH